MLTPVRRWFRTRVAVPPHIDGAEYVRLAPGARLVPPSKVRGELNVGSYSTMGGEHRVSGSVSIGRYCQVAPFTSFYADDHPVRHATSYVGAALFEGRMTSRKPAAPIVVGNDVYIGHGAVITKGVTIGDGAVVGAGAVVTRPVGAFEVVAGNPAVVKRRRFGDEVCRLLCEIRWWDLEPRELVPFEPVFSLPFGSSHRRYSRITPSLGGSAKPGETLGSATE